MKNRIIFRGTLTPQTPFRIGSSQESGVQNPIFRFKNSTHQDMPIIPSSSIRGTLRNEFSRLLSTQKESNDYCINSSTIPEPQHNCAFCEYFGSQIKKGKIKVTDCYPLRDHTLSFKPRVAIDRQSRTAKKGQIAKFEIVPPSIQFELNIILENFDSTNKVYKLFLFTLYELMTGKIKLGGQKSAGLGSFILDDLKVEIFDFISQKSMLFKPEISTFHEYYDRLIG